MTQGKDGSRDREKDYYSEEMEKDRRYEEIYSKYYDGIDDGRYARGKKNLSEMGRVLPKWDIVPPEKLI